MNYGELLDLFKRRLNRRDASQSLIETFITTSIQRTQRLLRTPASEVMTEIVIGPTYDGVAIPGDFLQLISIVVNDSELRRVSLSTALSAAKGSGGPKVFARNRAQFVLGPKPLPGDVVQIVYYADFSELSEPGDSNWLTDIASDVIIYGALSDACAHFTDPRMEGFENKFIQAIVDLNNMAGIDELTNGAVTPTSSFYFQSEEM